MKCALGNFFKKIERESLENLLKSVFNFHYPTSQINQPKNMTKKIKSDQEYGPNKYDRFVHFIQWLSYFNELLKTLFFLRLSIAIFGLF